VYRFLTTTFLALSVAAFSGYVTRLTAHKASQVCNVFLLLEVSVLLGLFFLVLVLVSTRFAFDHVSIRGACSIRWTRTRHILVPCLLLNIKCGDQIFNNHDLPLVFKGRGKTPP
jgi:hypothetical protein